MKVKDILVPGLKTISPNASMAEAEKIFRETRIRHLPVEKDGQIIGLVSDRDVQRAKSVVITGDKSESVLQDYKKVADYMSSPVLKMKLSDPLEDLIKDMIQMKISSFIIDDDKGHPVGIITTEDLLVVLHEKIHAPTVKNKILKFFRGFRT